MLAIEMKYRHKHEQNEEKLLIAEGSFQYMYLKMASNIMASETVNSHEF